MNSIIGTGSIFSQYKRIDSIGGGQKGGEKGFSDVLSKSLKDVTTQVRQNEKNVTQNVLGDMDLTKLTTDTAQLDVMISTITALRDKVITAIQELQKMPI